MVIFISLTLLVIIGLVDYYTGIELTFYVFYFTPIAFMSWHLGFGWGMLMTAACTTTWFTSDRFTGHAYSDIIYLYWNTGARFVSFTIITLSFSTIRKILNEERELSAKLSTALRQVKQLAGLLPICAACKKIRNDKGYWEQIETYIEAHSEADFSHGICPDCIARLYPETINKPDVDPFLKK